MAEATREQLIRAAETLFATYGIDGPSLREITRAAGQRNTAALQYHFGTREALLRGILDRTEPKVSGRREELLKPGRLSLRSLVEALVVPFAELLDDDEGGREYVQILHEIYSRPQRFQEFLEVSAVDQSLITWSDRIQVRVDPRAQGAPLHRRYAAVRFVLSEVTNRAREKHVKHALFTSNLIDMTQGVLSAQISKETAALID
jgi:AcrR family transcriptional regulator